MVAVTGFDAVSKTLLSISEFINDVFPELNSPTSGIIISLSFCSSLDFKNAKSLLVLSRCKSLAISMRVSIVLVMFIGFVYSVFKLCMARQNILIYDCSVFLRLKVRIMLRQIKFKMVHIAVLAVFVRVF